MAEPNQKMNYNNPDDSDWSSLDVAASNPQMVQYLYMQKAIIEAEKDMVFTQLASAINMPKHHGKRIKAYRYIPLLDDRNKNDQGIDAAGAKLVNGNLYGSTHDIGTINKKLPILSENGGRVNRVGFSRQMFEGTFENYGFFYEYSEDFENFDSDAQLMNRIYTEAIRGAGEIYEDMLQRDLIAGAGVKFFAGDATSFADISGDGASPDVVDYDILERLDRKLTENRCPLDTKMLTGSGNIDTRTIPSGRILYVGPEVMPILRNMTKKYGTTLEERVFIPVQQYASQTKTFKHEKGSIGNFRVVEVPEMLHWAGKGAAVTDNQGNFRETNSKYDVFPMLTVGDDSFNTIGFESTGGAGKAKLIIRSIKPGSQQAVCKEDPYGKSGFTSIQWWYGILIKRPERIGLILTVAPV